MRLALRNAKYPATKEVIKIPICLPSINKTIAIPIDEGRSAGTILRSSFFLSNSAIKIAKAEGLDGHALSIDMRKK